MTELDKCREKFTKYTNPIIAVTGSYGKTTTCKMIYELLKNKYTIDKTHENSNSFKGIPWCANKFFSLRSELWLIEIGIDHINEMEQLVDMVKPNIRIVTTIGEAHLTNFENKKEYQTEKLKFFSHMDEKNVVIINNDDPLLSSYIFNPNLKIIYCGSKETDDIQLMDVVINSDNITSTVHIRINANNTNLKFILNGICKHNALNCCLAIGCATYFNIPSHVIRKTMDKFTLYKNRGLISVKDKYTLYDYTYNCVIKACLTNLENFKHIRSNNKLIIIGLTISSTHFKNSDSSIVPILNYSLTITDHIILFPVNTDLMNRDEYKHVIQCNNYDEIIQQMKLLMTNIKLSIFIQAEHDLHASNLVDIILKTHM